MEYLSIPIRFGLVEKERSCKEIGGFLLLHNQDIDYLDGSTLLVIK